MSGTKEKKGKNDKAPRADKDKEMKEERGEEEQKAGEVRRFMA